MIKIRRTAAKVGFGLVAAASLLPVLAAPAWAGTDLSGATLVDSSNNPIGNSGPLASTQTFKVILPNGAACTGATATTGIQVGSFLANTSQGDPANYTYSNNLPNQGLTLFSTLGSAYQSINTNTDATINPGPVFGMKKYFTIYQQGGTGTVSQLYQGTWNMGITCYTSSSPRLADNVWSIPVTFSDSATDPNHFTWQLTPVATTPETPFAIALPISAIGLLGGGMLVLRRRRRNTTPSAVV